MGKGRSISSKREKLGMEEFSRLLRFWRLFLECFVNTVLLYPNPGSLLVSRASGLRLLSSKYISYHRYLSGIRTGNVRREGCVTFQCLACKRSCPQNKVPVITDISRVKSGNLPPLSCGVRSTKPRLGLTGTPDSTVVRNTQHTTVCRAVSTYISRRCFNSWVLRLILQPSTMSATSLQQCFILVLLISWGQPFTLSGECHGRAVSPPDFETAGTGFKPNRMHGEETATATSSDNLHPCSRPCKVGDEPMTCRYKFSVEWYMTMSKACYDCKSNKTDCFRMDCIPGDGFKRPVVVVNRQLPGPSIEVCLGDEILVELHNHLMEESTLLQVCLGDEILVELHNHLMEESTTIHWHGHHQRGTQFMDGVPYVTQCPVQPKSAFRYRYWADTPGTHFWHSHTGCQRGDGMFGGLVVRVPRTMDPHSDLYDHDLPEHLIQVLDWGHELGVVKFLDHHHSDGDNKPRNILVNGLGRIFPDNSPDMWEDSETTQLSSEFFVQQGHSYRFRIVNAGFLNVPIELSVDNHTLLVISSDGSDVKPVEVDSLVTYAGERFDFVLNASQEVHNYWMRFRGLMDGDERFTSVHQVAVLRYQGAPLDEDPVEDVGYEEARREGLVSTHNTPSSGVRGVRYDANHPFHLHGHGFRVVAMERLNSSITEEDVRSLDKAGLIRRKLSGAPLKDTVTVPDGGYTIVRFHANNPGYWLFHCHIEFHVEIGMALVFKVGEHSDFPPVPRGFPQCNNWLPTEEDLDVSDPTTPKTTTSTITYSENDEDNAIPNIISITHWWPLLTQTSARISIASVAHSDLIFVLGAALFLSAVLR
uniref:Laccase n=1 Tax=Timema bartmani TaxID=61472 RepID=A0A7R9F458_9NEOP|nr:unnamed protein product [Timema bartmani]